MARVSGVGIAALLALTATPALALDDIALPIETAATELTPNQFVWHDTDSGEALSIVISLSTQRAYVYRGAQMVAATTIHASLLVLVTLTLDRRLSVADDARARSPRTTRPARPG